MTTAVLQESTELLKNEVIQMKGVVQQYKAASESIAPRLANHDVAFQEMQPWTAEVERNFAGHQQKQANMRRHAEDGLQIRRLRCVVALGLGLGPPTAPFQPTSTLRYIGSSC